MATEIIVKPEVLSKAETQMNRLAALASNRTLTVSVSSFQGDSAENLQEMVKMINNMFKDLGALCTKTETALRTTREEFVKTDNVCANYFTSKEE